LFFTINKRTTNKHHDSYREVTLEITTERQKNHELAEYLVIVTSLWDFQTIRVNFLSTHIKSLTGLPRRGKMLVENSISKNEKSRRDVILTLSVTSD